MELRITYRMELYLEGDSVSEIKEQFERLPLQHYECGSPNFIELVSVENADTYQDMMHEWKNTHNNEQ